MAITAYSYLDEDRVGVIQLVNDLEFESAAYTYKVFISNVYTYYDLYPLNISGTGVLNSTNNILTITIPQPPKHLELTVGTFKKRFAFTDGGTDGDKTLVYAPAFQVGNDNGTTNCKGFILFNLDPDAYATEETFRASLINSSNEVVGYALGMRFLTAQPSSGSSRWGFGGIVFPRVIWLSKPSSITELKFMLKLNSEIFSTNVVYSGSEFTSPTSSRFNVLSNHKFIIERKSNTYFYL